MDKQNFIEKIKTSPIDDKRKQEIVSLLENNDFSQEIKEQIKDIIQRDIEESTADLDMSEDREEIESATKELSEGLLKIEKTLNEDTKFVEDEMKELQVMIKDLDKIVDQVKIDSIKASI